MGIEVWKWLKQKSAEAYNTIQVKLQVKWSVYNFQTEVEEFITLYHLKSKTVYM